MTNKPYIDPVDKIGWLLQNYPSARTGAVLTSTEFGNLTIITHRVLDWDEILTQLPAIQVDIHPEAVDYMLEDQTAFRLIPLTVLLYIPIMTRGKVEADALAEEIRSDQEIKTLFADLEEVLQSGIAMKGIADELILVGGGGIAYEALEWEGDVGIRLRVAQVNLLAKSQIR